MSAFSDYKKMMDNLNEEKLSDLFKVFLTNNDAAMNILFKYSSDFGLMFNSQEIKENMIFMHKNGNFDNIDYFGIEL